MVDLVKPDPRNTVSVIIGTFGVLPALDDLLTCLLRHTEAFSVQMVFSIGGDPVDTALMSS